MKNLYNTNIKATLASIIFLTSFTFCYSQAKHKDFVGKWLRNNDKCDWGTLSKAYFGLPELRIIQGESFYIVQQDTVASNATKLAFDGSSAETTVVGTGGPRKKESKMKWTSESSFVENDSYSGSLTYSSDRTYLLSGDGKTLTISAHIDYKPLNAIYDVKMVYEKQ